MRNPSAAQVARSLGLRAEVDGQRFDLVVLGAGPAGLAAAVYGGSEGLRTFVAESWAPGGQAGTSARIENYLGFPSGIGGRELTRRRRCRRAASTPCSPASTPPSSLPTAPRVWFGSTSTTASTCSPARW